MFRLFAPVFAGLLLLGCQQDKNADMASSKDPNNTMADVCPTCPGVQHATADGVCERCGQKADR